MNQRTFNPPAYLHKWTPSLHYILSLNEDYRTNIIVWNIQHKKDLESLELRKQALNKRSATGNVTGMEWQQYDRQLEDLIMQKDRQKTIEHELKSQIQFEAADLFGAFHQIQADFQSDYLSLVVYIGYLKGFKAALDTGNGLECFIKPPYEDIIAAINQYLPVTNKN